MSRHQLRGCIRPQVFLRSIEDHFGQKSLRKEGRVERKRMKGRWGGGLECSGNFPPLTFPPSSPPLRQGIRGSAPLHPTHHRNGPSSVPVLLFALDARRVRTVAAGSKDDRRTPCKGRIRASGENDSRADCAGSGWLSGLDRLEITVRCAAKMCTQCNFRPAASLRGPPAPHLTTKHLYPHHALHHHHHAAFPLPSPPTYPTSK